MILQNGTRQNNCPKCHLMPSRNTPRNTQSLRFAYRIQRRCLLEFQRITISDKYYAGMKWLAQWKHHDHNLYNIFERHVSYSNWYIKYVHFSNTSAVWYSWRKYNVWHIYRQPLYSPIPISPHRALATSSYCQYVISNNALLHDQPFANNWSSVAGAVIKRLRK